MKRYKFVAEHPEHFEMQDSKDGKSFKVAKKGLTKALLGKIQAMAEGGVVEPERIGAFGLKKSPLTVEEFIPEPKDDITPWMRMEELPDQLQRAAIASRDLDSPTDAVPVLDTKVEVRDPSGSMSDADKQAIVEDFLKTNPGQSPESAKALLFPQMRLETSSRSGLDMVKDFEAAVDRKMSPAERLKATEGMTPEQKKAFHQQLYGGMTSEAIHKKTEEKIVQEDAAKAVDEKAKAVSEREARDQLYAVASQPWYDGMKQIAGIAGPPRLPQVPKLGELPSIDEVQKARAAEQAAISQDAANAEAKAKEVAAVQAQLQKDQAERRERFERNRKFSQITSNALALAAVARKVDPQRLWGSMSTANKMAAGMAMALGGAAQGTLGGDNPGWAVIQKAIDADIDAQKANAVQTNNLYAQHLKRMESEEAAYKQTQADLLNFAQTRLNQVAASYSGKDAQTKAAALNARLEQAKAQAQHDVAMLQVQREDINKQNQYARDREQSMMGMNFATASNKARATQLAMSGVRVPQDQLWLLDEKMRSNAVKMMDGTYAIAMTPQTKEAADKAIVAYNNAADAIDNLLAYIDRGSPGSNNPLSNQQAEVARQSAKLLLNNIVADISGKTVSDQERETWKQIISDPTTAWSLASRTRAKLQNLKDTMAQRQNRAVQQYVYGKK